MCGQCKTPSKFPSAGLGSSDPAEHAVAVLSQGAWRACASCVGRRGAAAPFARKSKELIVCRSCSLPKPVTSFNRKHVNDLSARGDLQDAVCLDCNPAGLHFSVQSHRRLLRCKECKQDKLTSQFDVAFLKTHRSEKDAVCTACMDETRMPLCKGGCGRRPLARLTNGYEYWCDSCKYPPCARCKTAPRPKITKNVVWKKPEWICSECRQ